MEDLYPPIEPAQSGWLEVGDGHRLYFEVCGNQQGAPVLFLHGGPGSSTNPGSPPLLRPVVLSHRPVRSARLRPVDAERGDRAPIPPRTCWKTSSACASTWAWSAGCCSADRGGARWRWLTLRPIRSACAAWSCAGCSWPRTPRWRGSLRGSGTSCRRRGRRSPVACREPSCAGLIAHYHEAVGRGDMSAAQRWNAYENATMAVGEAGSSAAAPPSPELLARVRVQLHYLASHCFLAARPADARLVPHRAPAAVVVQGRRDLACPPVTAYTLAQAWPAARLWMVEEAGHSAMHPALRAALVRATEELQGRSAPCRHEPARPSQPDHHRADRAVHPGDRQDHRRRHAQLHPRGDRGGHARDHAAVDRRALRKRSRAPAHRARARAAAVPGESGAGASA